MVKLDTGEATINNLGVLSTILGIPVTSDAINNSVLGYLNDIPAAAAVWDSSFNITHLNVLKAYEEWGLEDLLRNHLRLQRYYSRIRNSGIIAHIDAGKTTVTERMLYYAGYTNRIGNVDDGSTVTDCLPMERDRGITISSACIPLGWNNHKINLIDTPGHVDFTIEVERSMRVLDGAVVVLDGVAGVEAQTENVWLQANRYSVPRVAFINKMDREGSSFAKTAQQLSKLKGAGTTLLIQWPLILDEPIAIRNGNGGPGFSKIIDLLDMTVIDWEQDPINRSLVRKITFDDFVKVTNHPNLDVLIQGKMELFMYEVVREKRIQLIEALSEMDEEIIDTFLACDADHFNVSTKDIKRSIRKMTILGKCVPTMCGAAFRNIGIQPLMDAMVDYLPSPDNAPLPKEMVNDSNKLCALAFKVLDDEKKGPLVFVRVYSGSIRPRLVLKNNTQNLRETVGKCLQMYADEYEEIPMISAGNIAAISGLKFAKTGDTLSEWNDKSSVCLYPMSVIPPVISRSIRADSPAEEKKMTQALSIVQREDPSIHVSTDEETGELLLSGMGELHLEICTEKLRNRHKLKFSEGPVSVSYRQSVLDSHRNHYSLFEKKILGNDVKIGFKFDISPLNLFSNQVIPASSAENKVDSVLEKDSIYIGDEPLINFKTSPQIPPLDLFIAAIHQGLCNSLERGSSKRYPFINTHVTLKSIHLLEGFPFSEGLLRMASYSCLNNVLCLNQSILLEPAMKLEIQTHDAHVKSVSKNLISFRNGHILSLNDTGSAELKKIIAMVPLSGMEGYSSHFRSLTKGKGHFSYSFEGYAPKASSFN